MNRRRFLVAIAAVALAVGAALWTGAKTAPRCTYCRSKNVVPIVYGKPDSDTIKAADHGKVHLGGCMPREQHWYCNACKRDF